MGTYFALTDQITELAEQLDKKGELNKLFQQAHAKREQQEKNKETVIKEREDK